jgi:hypothetical protein
MNGRTLGPLAFGLAALVAAGLGARGFDGIASRFIRPADQRFSPEQQASRIRSLRHIRWREVEGPARAAEQDRRLTELLARHRRLLIQVQLDSCVPCKKAVQSLRTILPRYPAVVLLEASLDAEEWVSIEYVLGGRGWMMKYPAVPYFVAVKDGSPLGFFVGFEAAHATTKAAHLTSSEPAGDTVSLESVVARLAAEETGTAARTSAAPGAAAAPARTGGAHER